MRCKLILFLLLFAICNIAYANCCPGICCSDDMVLQAAYFDAMKNHDPAKQAKLDKRLHELMKLYYARDKIMQEMLMEGIKIDHPLCVGSYQDMSVIQ